MTIPQDILKETERKYPYISTGVMHSQGANRVRELLREAYAAGAMAERQKLQQAVKPSTHVTP
jgi:hypothetical protein